MRKKNINQKSDINQKKDKPSYAKMFKEQLKKEAELNSNKSQMSHNKNTSKIENKNKIEEKQEVKHNKGINFDNLNDWDNIVYPEDNEIKNIISNNVENININQGNINNDNNFDINKNINQNEFQNNIINQIKEDNNDDDSEKAQLEQIQQNINNANNVYNNLNTGIKNNNALNEFSVNTSEFTNKNEILNQYDNISLGTYNLDNNNNVINNNLINNKRNQNLFNDNIVSQIKPLDFGTGLNDINNVIKEEDSLENEDKNLNDNKDNNNYNNENNNNKNFIDNKNNNEFDDLKAQRDIMEQMEEEMNLSMNQMNELAGIKDNKNKIKSKAIKKEDNKNKRRIDNKNINQKKVDNRIINDKQKKNNNNNNNYNINNNNNMNNNIINKNNNFIPLNNLNNNINDQNNKFNPNNFSFKPTNIQQVSAEEVNAFIQKSQQKNIGNNNISLTEQPKIISPIQPSLNQPQINANINNMQPSLNQPQINTNINPNINININPNIPIQANMPPMYPSPYPIVFPQNQNPQMMYGIPYGIYPGNGYSMPVQNQFGQYPNPQFQNNIEMKNEKKKINYKPKSLKEYKQKYNNEKKEHRGGLGANIGGEEWEHKKEQNLKVKKYSEMIKNQNKDKETHFKNKFKIKNELNEQLYDSLSDDVLEDEPKEKEKDKETNNIKNENKIQETNTEPKETKRPGSNNLKYLMQLKKDKEKEKENKSKDNKIKQGKYSKYKKIVIESIDKHPDNNEKKMGKIYTTYKPPMQRRPSTKDKNNLVKQNNKQRSQSTGLKGHIYKKNNNNYDDELTKKFMSPVPNDYNGYANNKDKDNNFISPTFEIENLLQKKEQYDSKIKEIKNFLKM